MIENQKQMDQKMDAVFEGLNASLIIRDGMGVDTWECQSVWFSIKRDDGEVCDVCLIREEVEELIWFLKSFLGRLNPPQPSVDQ